MVYEKLVLILNPGITTKTLFKEVQSKLQKIN